MGLLLNYLGLYPEIEDPQPFTLKTMVRTKVHSVSL